MLEGGGVAVLPQFGEILQREAVIVTERLHRQHGRRGDHEGSRKRQERTDP